MTPKMFIAKWTASNLKESASSQEHLLNLCHLVPESVRSEA